MPNYSGLSGFALAGAIRDEERKKKEALGLLDSLEKERSGARVIDDAQQRTMDWLATLSPEDRAKVPSEAFNVPTQVQGIENDLGNFNLMDRARQLGLTGKYSDVPEVQNYLNEPFSSKQTQQKIDMGNIDLSNAKRNQEQYGKAGTAIEDLVSQYKLADALGDKTFNLKSAAMETLTPYANDARVKQTLETFVGKPISGGGIGAATFQRRDDWNKISSMEDGFEKDKAIDDFMMTYAPGTAFPLTEKGINKAGEKASVVKTAQNLAPEKLSEKETTNMESMRSQYANLSNAADKFNTDFVTPYIGKGIKMAYLRQTDPKFAEFFTPLSLALNEYRRQNFGTAQTQSEIQNFLDVVNTELNVAPEVFQKQLKGVMNAIERDYANVVTTRKQQNKDVPKNLDDVKPKQKTATPKRKRYNAETGKFEVVE